MIKTSDSEHAEGIEADGDEHGNGACAHPENSHGSHMH
jgi:hypothetical protein